MNKNLFDQLVLSISERLKASRSTGVNITPELVSKNVRRTLAELKEDAPTVEFNDSDIKALIFKISNVFTITVDEELVILTNTLIQKWFNSSKKDIEWGHWSAYEKMLKKQARSEATIKANEDVINAVLDCSGDPRRKGPWASKGLVMGNVQSGKTQNYIGLINKAIDCGYKTIILLGGHLNDLRQQTQERVDEGVLGRESKHLIDIKKGKTSPIGVGEFGINNVNSGTTTIGDFTKPFADKLGFSLSGSDPVIFTIKKHSGVMKRLHEWIRDHHYLDVKEGKKLDNPLLLIDDEADYATVNTKHHREEITSTNEGVRNLLSLFNKSTYVGYTATPFANIFIDPDENTYSDEDDLFPSDFMIKIPAPNNYLGQKYYFDGSSKAIIPLEANNPLYELKKDSVITKIPKSLQKAVRAFCLVCAIRAIRDDDKAHSSMLVNVSHLKEHQNKLELLIQDYFDELKNAYTAYSGLGMIGVRSNPLLSDLENTFYEIFKIKESYSDVFKYLVTPFDEIKVSAINQSNGKNDKVLDYSTNRENGLKVIVIGGHKLSRGLTLEGLAISYFTRNSKAYDTLMQMCRWFGYRPNYDDLCRVFMSRESEAWYSFIAEAIEELYSELGIMRDRSFTPRDFGLKVREHPGAMIVTAKNKMGSAVSEVRTQDLWGQILRRFRFKSDINQNSINLKFTKDFLRKLSDDRNDKISLKYKDPRTSSLIFSEVSYEDVINFINNINLPEDDVGNKALIHQLKEMSKDNTIPKFRVAIFNQKNIGNTTWEKNIDDQSEIDFINTAYSLLGENINMPKRLLLSNGDTFYKPSVNLGNSDDEKIFLSEEERDRIKSIKKNAVSYDYIASPDRDYPTLIIYFFAVAIDKLEQDKDSYKLGHGKMPTVGFTVAIPRPEHLKGKTQKELKKLVKNTKYSYQLNKIAQRLSINFIEEYTDE